MKFATLIVAFTSIVVVVEAGHGHLKSRQSGGFITSPCAADSACTSGCCGFTSGKCEGACVALQRQGCGHGTASPNANAAAALGQCSSLVTAFQAAHGAGAGSSSGTGTGSGAGSGAGASAPAASSAPGTGTSSAPGARGSQFITGQCAANNDCVSGCCVTRLGTCGAVGAQPNGAADCQGGVALPNLNGGSSPASSGSGSAGSGAGSGAGAAGAGAPAASAPATGGSGTSTGSASGARGSQFITGKCAANNDCVSGCCVTSKGTCGAVGAQPNGAADCQGGVALPNLNQRFARFMM